MSLKVLICGDGAVYEQGFMCFNNYRASSISPCFTYLGIVFFGSIIALAVSAAWWISLATGQIGPPPEAPLTPKDPLPSLQLQVKRLRSISHGLDVQGKAKGLRSSVPMAVVPPRKAQASWGK